MNIVLGSEAANELRGKYTVLTLDTFRISGHDEPITSYCVLDMVPIQDMCRLEELVSLHEKLIENYGRRNWMFCQQALEHLIGCWNRELDTFYADLARRIGQFSDQEPLTDWTPIIDR